MSQFLENILSIEHAGTILLLGAVAVLVVIAIYVVNWARGLAYGENDEPEEVMLTDFQQLKSEGKLTEAEYEKVKTSTIEPVTGKPLEPAKDRLAFQDYPEEHGAPPVEPTDDPPITLAEALKRKKESG